MLTDVEHGDDVRMVERCGCLRLAQEPIRSPDVDAQVPLAEPTDTPPAPAPAPEPEPALPPPVPPSDAPPNLGSPRAFLDYSDGHFFLRSAGDKYLLTAGGRVHLDTYSFAGPGLDTYRKATGTGLKTNMFFRRFILEVGGIVRQHWFSRVNGHPAHRYFAARPPKDSGREAPYALQVVARVEVMRLRYSGNERSPEESARRRPTTSRSTPTSSA